MSNAPVLVLQMQRMGDLVMTFPLLGWLARHFPGHPVWTIAEPRFFTALCKLAPQTVFFPPEAYPRMRTTRFRCIINLSHRPDAAHMAGTLGAEQRFGAHTRGDATYIDGDWSLYRASIVHNNRHNLFHWSDLQLLEHVASQPLPHQPSCPAPAKDKDSIGLFVGASEAGKRPNPQFWGELAQRLLRKGFRPFFLGGPDDVALGAASQQAAGIPGSNLCGRFSVGELAEVMSTLALCITPDTGPMHLAAWMNTPVLNLSLGNVHPWETGPVPPGHHVLRPRISCAGCWRCHHATLRCHQAFHPGRVALLVHTLLRQPQRLPQLFLPGLEVYRTARESRGLYRLTPMHGTPATPRMLLAHFWQEWFWERKYGRNCSALPHILKDLTSAAPALPEHLQRAVLRMEQAISRQLGGRSPELVDASFWNHYPPLLRAFTGHLQLRLQNQDFSAAAWKTALHDVELLADVVRQA